MTINEYIDKVNTRYKAGISTEHSYRGDLQNLLESIATDVLITNEPSRVACGAPDYIITKNSIPVGYIEAKDVGKPLNSKDYKEQFDRYKKFLGNLIITDYLEFQLFREGEFVLSISIGEILGNRIVAKTDCFEPFIHLIKDFCTLEGQTIKSASKLAKMMAGKARMLTDVIEKALTPIEDSNQLNEPANTTLQDQLNSFKQILIHDITPKGFADIYAQTIAYGMFAARLHDPTLNTFSRQEAADLIPKSNPFLRKLFQYIAGYDLDDRIKWIVDALADIFRATNVAELLKDFGKSTQQHDPIIHFYETFLSEYDPALRKSRGVWYTPEPVVNFIVRAVDDILKTEFGLTDGLANTSKVKIKVKDASKATADLRSKTKTIEREEEVHRVQILDPATGTGTFLAEVVKQIYKRFEGQQGIWSKYVEDHLIPRLNGFEILMASYAMAHLKLDMLLSETGYRPSRDQRFKIYLTNSLEEHHPDTGTLFANWLSTEANEANHVKRDTPVMIVLGNPPYSGVSSNKGEWISNLIEDYKYVDGEHFNERKHWLNDDYVKFIRYGQHFVEKNGSGILAFINPHGYLDNPTFRGMRWHLMKTFNKIYTIDLHGNSKKKEVSPDGTIDQNVFDIMQGVSINIFIKTKKNETNDLAKVFHFDLYGKRDIKYDFLTNKNLSLIPFNELLPQKPFLFFVPKDTASLNDYNKGFKICELLNVKTVGFVTANDGFNISHSKNEHLNKIADILELEQGAWRHKYNRRKDSRDWTYLSAKHDASSYLNDSNLIEISYRPFDNRFTLYSGNSRGLYSSPQRNVMQHFLKGENLGLLVTKAFQDKSFSHVFITNKISEAIFLSGTTGTNAINFPLYIYPDLSSQHTIAQNPNRIPNLNSDLINQIAHKLGLLFTNEKTETENSFSPIDILDYIYSVLHSPDYRDKFKEFLKSDYPRIPYPKNTETFWQLVRLGGDLRHTHLFESPIIEKFITTYPQSGSNEVDKIKYENQQVWINSQQYFDKVPSVAWEFYIGGYQPAQKWLKDRKGRVLSYEDILHYQKIIVALSETDRLMKEIDEIGVE